MLWWLSWFVMQRDTVWYDWNWRSSYDIQSEELWQPIGIAQYSHMLEKLFWLCTLICLLDSPKFDFCWLVDATREMKMKKTTEKGPTYSNDNLHTTIPILIKGSLEIWCYCFALLLLGSLSWHLHMHDILNLHMFVLGLLVCLLASVLQRRQTRFAREKWERVFKKRLASFCTIFEVSLADGKFCEIRKDCLRKVKFEDKMLACLCDRACACA